MILQKKVYPLNFCSPVSIHVIIMHEGVNDMHLNSFIFANIQILLTVNILIFLTVLYISAREHARTRRLASCRSRYEDALENKTGQFPPVCGTLHLYAACEAAGRYFDTDPVSTAAFIHELNLDTRLIPYVKKHPSLYRLKLLAGLHSPDAAAVFRALIHTLHDRTALYSCFYGLALADNKDHSMLDSLLASLLATDRKVELLALMEPAPAEYLKLLENTEQDTARLILLRVICDTCLPPDKDFYDRIVPYLSGSFEVRIAAVNALSSSGMPRYLPQLKALYYKADSWQLRAVLASAMVRYSLDDTRELLTEMAHDTAWWVRYNSVRSLSGKGEEGMDVIRDIAADTADANAASMANALLDSYPVQEVIS